MRYTSTSNSHVLYARLLKTQKNIIFSLYLTGYTLFMIADELKALVKGSVEYGADILEKFSRDASLYHVEPAVVVHPKNAEDVKAVVRFA